VVLTDLRLPTLDGVQVIRQITGVFPDIQVVVFSVYDSQASKQAALAAGACAFLSKGCPPQDICDTVLQAGL
jgi:two-component system, response regulator YesN